MQFAAYSNPYGWPVRTVSGFVYNRTGTTSVVGDVWQLDLGGTDTDVTALDVDEIWGSAITCTTAGISLMPKVVVMEADVADNGLTKVAIQSPKILVQYASTGGTTAVGDGLYSVNSSDGLESDVPAAGVVVCIGIALVAADGVNYAVFNGFGLGLVQSAGVAAV